MPTPGRGTRTNVRASCTPPPSREMAATVPWRPTPFKMAPSTEQKQLRAMTAARGSR